MFSRLRLRLTGLYLGVAILLVALLGGAAYGLVNFYFESSTDLAMQRKMAHEFRERQVALPSELGEADLAWEANQAGSPQEHGHTSVLTNDEDSEGELAAITLLIIDHEGNPLAPLDGPVFQRLAYQPAVDAAATQGRDTRTIQKSNGLRLRLLTYRLGPDEQSGQPVFIQLSRAMTDQDRILRSLLTGLMVLGAGSILILGAGSWWLAGRSIKPAQQAWEQQQMFVANASHELRTPLTLLRASAETMQQNFADGIFDADDNRTLLADMLSECDHTAHLVGDLMLLSRLDAGQMKFEISDIAIPDLLSEMERQARPLADARHVSLHVKCATGLARADLMRVRQILLILVDNALRYTPAGGTILLEAEPRGHMVEIRISDTGSGIAPEHLPHIFDRFYQADTSHTAKGNSGLGLSIAKALLEAQHGAIAVESAVGKGTCVTISLPSAVGGGSSARRG